MKLLVLDIETGPTTAYVWGLFKQNVGLNQIIEPGRVLCYAAKFVGDADGIFDSEWHSGQDGMAASLHALLDEADAVISYNGKSFDIPHINRLFLEQGLNPPSPYAHIDLYQTVRSKFRFVSGKLDHVVQQLELGGKAATGGFELWTGVLNGDPAAQARMEGYNWQDVIITEELYVALRPWISNHPNEGLFSDKPHVCPVCGSDHLQKRGTKRTGVSVFQTWQCQDCGSWSRTGKRTKGVDLRPVT